MQGEHAIGQELAQLGLGPAADDALGHHVQIGARVDAVGDARADDREDGGRALATLVEPREQPVLLSEHQPSQLAFSAVIGELDVAIVEEQPEPRPLPVQVPKRSPQRSLGRCHAAMQVDEGTKLLEYGDRVCGPPGAALLGRVAREGGRSLDGEQPRDDAQRSVGDEVACSRGFDQAASPVRPTAQTLATGALDEVGDGGAVALDGAPEVLAEESTHAVGVAGGGEYANVTQHALVQHHITPLRIPSRASGSRIGTPVASVASNPGARVWSAIALASGANRSSPAATERLRCDRGSGPRESCALALEREVLDVLFGDGLDDQRIAELALVDDRPGRRGGHDRVVVGARDGLVETHAHDDLGRNHIEDLAAPMVDRKPVTGDLPRGAGP